MNLLIIGIIILIVYNICRNYDAKQINLFKPNYTFFDLDNLNKEYNRIIKYNDAVLYCDKFNIKNKNTIDFMSTKYANEAFKNGMCKFQFIITNSSNKSTSGALYKMVFVKLRDSDNAYFLFEVNMRVIFNPNTTKNDYLIKSIWNTCVYTFEINELEKIIATLSNYKTIKIDSYHARFSSATDSSRVI